VDANPGLDALLATAQIAAAAPIIVGLFSRLHVPQVVVVLSGGVLIGPDVLGWAEPTSIVPFVNQGLGFLFLLAGYELDFGVLRAAPGRLAILGWYVSMVLARGVVGLLAATGLIHASVPVSLALTTTALGTLLPILRENGMLGGAFGGSVVAAGAVGEFFPIVAIATVLSAKGQFVGLLSRSSSRSPRCSSSMCRDFSGADAWGSSPSRVRMRRPPRRPCAGRSRSSSWSPNGSASTSCSVPSLPSACCGAGLLARLNGSTRSSTPSAMGALHPDLLRGGWDEPRPGLDRQGSRARGGVLGGAALVRGAPAFLIYRRSLARRERFEMVFLSATSLPLLVAVSQIGLANGTMLPENAAALVGAGVLSVLVYPAVARAIRGSQQASTGSQARHVHD